MWSQPELMARVDLGHYQVTAQGPQRVATAFDYHPAPVGLNARTNIYYLETRDHGKTWQNVKGERVELPLRAAQNAALVHDYQR